MLACFLVVCCAVADRHEQNLLLPAGFCRRFDVSLIPQDCFFAAVKCGLLSNQSMPGIFSWCSQNQHFE